MQIITGESLFCQNMRFEKKNDKKYVKQQKVA